MYCVWYAVFHLLVLHACYHVFLYHNTANNSTLYMYNGHVYTVHINSGKTIWKTNRNAYIIVYMGGKCARKYLNAAWPYLQVIYLHNVCIHSMTHRFPLHLIVKLTLLHDSSPEWHIVEFRFCVFFLFSGRPSFYKFLRTQVYISRH